MPVISNEHIVAAWDRGVGSPSFKVVYETSDDLAPVDQGLVGRAAAAMDREIERRLFDAASLGSWNVPDPAHMSPRELVRLIRDKWLEGDAVEALLRWADAQAAPEPRHQTLPRRALDLGGADGRA